MPLTGSSNCFQDADASLLIYPDFNNTIFNTAYVSQAKTIPNGVELIFEAYDDKTNFGISEPLFSIKYITTLVCATGSPSVTRTSNGNHGAYVISGIGSVNGCNGNYTVSYEVQALQAATLQFPSATQTVRLGTGFKQYHALVSGQGGRKFSRAGILDNSDADNFVIQVPCSVSISNNTITLPTYLIPGILNNPSGSATPFEIKLDNCQNGSGTPSVWLTWRFTSVHPTDPKALLNSDSSSSPARNIALNMYFVDQNSIKKLISHQVPLDTGYKLDSPSKALRHFVQYVVTPEGQADNNSIQPGRFSGQAQLFVQYQ